MNIIISGFGKMGRLIEERARLRGWAVTAIIDPQAAQGASNSAVCKDFNALPSNASGVVIDFTSPESAFSNISSAVERGLPIVVGTTGWYEHLSEAVKIIKKQNGAMLYAPNFSLGVNLFYKIIAEATSLMDRFDAYDAGGFEAHHNKKADSPSGTAKNIAKIILKNSSRKKHAVYDKLDRPPFADELHIASLRVGSVPGTHSVIFDSEADSIEIRHTARSREGLVSGALFAAEWLNKRFSAGSRGIFTFEDALA